LRKIILNIKNKDYIDFLKATQECGKLTAEDMLYDLIHYYVIIERNKAKLFYPKQKKLSQY